MTDQGTPKPKKQSLKDIARRVSTIPPSPNAAQGSRPRKPLDSMRPVSVTAPPPAPADRMKELADICEATSNDTTAPEPAAEPAPPLAHRSRLATVAPIAGGIAVGLGAIALSVFVLTRGPETPSTPPASPAAAVPPAPEVAAVPPAPEVAATAPVLEDHADTTTANDETAPSPNEGAKPAEETAEGAEEEVPPADDDARAEAAHADPQPSAPASPSDEKEAESDEPEAEGTDEAEADRDEPKGLSGAMAEAVGDEASGDESNESTAEKPTRDRGSMPMTPSQGQAQSAMAAVRGAARGCVAGMASPSRATVTFGSNGRVSSVGVSGAAAGKPAAACIRSALSSARVPPFKKSSFTVGITLRP